MDSTSPRDAHRTFSQRSGYEPVPAPMRLEEVESPGEYGGFLGEWSNDVASEFKRIVLESKFNQLLDFLESIVCDRHVDNGFGVGIASHFDRHAAAYWLDVSARPYRFFPRSNRAQGDAARNAIKTMRQAGMGGAEAHLRQAAEHINSRRYAESVKDSILAVESVARVIDPKAEKTLGAMFMFGACASFVAYLTNKHQQSTDTSEGHGGE